MNTRRNNFDALRLLAALTVLISHAVPITSGDNRHEIMFQISHGQTSGGGIAVDVFFAMSGYLITASYLNTPDPWRFAAARFLRILPALAAVTVLLTLVLGPWVTSLPVTAYFTGPETWHYLWRNLLARDECCLPGVFPANPIAGKMNYSLWTLQHEINCYAVILCLGVAGLLRRHWMAPAYCLSLAASAFWVGGAFGPFLAVFMGGATMRVWRVPLDGRVAALCAVAWACGLPLPGYRLFSATFGVYTVLFLALSPSIRLPDAGRRGDLSYGLYIWSYPVQQSVRMAMGPDAAWYWNAIVSLPIALSLAAVSWHWVEAPCQRLKTRFRPAAAILPLVPSSEPAPGAPPSTGA